MYLTYVAYNADGPLTRKNPTRNSALTKKGPHKKLRLLIPGQEIRERLYRSQDWNTSFPPPNKRSGSVLSQLLVGGPWRYYNADYVSYAPLFVRRIRSTISVGLGSLCYVCFARKE